MLGVQQFLGQLPHSLVIILCYPSPPMMHIFRLKFSCISHLGAYLHVQVDPGSIPPLQCHNHLSPHVSVHEIGEHQQLWGWNNHCPEESSLWSLTLYHTQHSCSKCLKTGIKTRQTRHFPYLKWEIKVTHTRTFWMLHYPPTECPLCHVPEHGSLTTQEASIYWEI